MIEPTLLQERYRLLRLLGEGGVAEVWLADDQTLHRQVAVKILRSQYARDAALLERFRREAKHVAQLASPHIVEIYDVQTAQSPPFLVMEFVDGEDLKERLRHEGRLPVPRALALLRDVASGVAVAHEAGLVHRDLKPGNVLLARDGAVKVTDFGIARDVAEGGLTEPGTVWGTSHYIAPEQAQGQAVTPASDLYSLGVILFELLTGRVPFPGSDPVAVAIAHIQEPPPDVAVLAPGVPAAVARLVARLLAKRPEERPPDAAALVQILDGYVAQSSDATTLRPAVSAPAPPTAPSPALPAERPPPRARPAPTTGRPLTAAALLLPLLLLCLLSLGGGLWWQQRRPTANAAAAALSATQTAAARLPTFTGLAGGPAASRTPRPSPSVTPSATALPVLLAGPRQGNGPDALAYALVGGVKIAVDGSLNEWGGQPVTLLQPVGGAAQWSGPADLSGEARFAWDEEFLYLAVTRTDEAHLQPFEGYELYRGDSVELWLDVQLTEDFDVAQANAGGLLDDFQLAFSPGDFGRLRPEGVVYYPEPRDAKRDRELRVRAEPLPNGYTLEARIPWALLAIEPSPNLVLGYAVVLNDNDPPQSQEPQTQVSSNGREPFQKPLTFGNLLLTGEER